MSDRSPLEEIELLQREVEKALHERDIWQATAEMWQTNHAVRERERDEALALLTVGLVLWDSEPRPSLRSNWYGFWQKVAKEK